MTTKPPISEAEAEQLIDRRVQALLNTDRAYLHAEDPIAQAAREEQITTQVEHDVYRAYAVQ